MGDMMKAFKFLLLAVFVVLFLCGCYNTAITTFDEQPRASYTLETVPQIDETITVTIPQEQSEAPKEHLSEDVPPEDVIPDENIPEERAPGENPPKETVPEETEPEETVPEEPMPEETVPEEPMPEETVPEEPVPEETVPEETVPRENVPEETVPEDTLPEETLPESSVPEEPEHTHCFSEETFSPTCEKDGFRMEICSCGYQITSTLPATGHHWKYHHTPEQGHYEGRIACHCGGWSCSADSDYVASFQAHVAQVPQEERYHHSYFESVYWIVDVPSEEWFDCAVCGSMK